jgi:nucleoside-diphosphate-sugar epimerase
MRVLLTGATSFLGRHITSHLLRAGFEVTATFRTPHSCLDELQSLSARLTLVRFDLADERSYSALPRSVDAVIHVAGVSMTPDVSLDDMLSCNVVGGRNVLRYALSARASKLICTSTISVHGRIEANVVTEATGIMDPDVYGASKLLAERMFAAVVDQLPAAAIRLPGVIGRGAHRAWVPTMLERIRAGQELTIYNPDAPFNNAAHVDDLGYLVSELLCRDWAGFHAFPVGAAGSITVSGAIERLMAGNARVPVRIGHAPQRGFTISSDYAVNTFGYRPMDIGPMLDRYVAESRPG